MAKSTPTTTTAEPATTTEVQPARNDLSQLFHLPDWILRHEDTMKIEELDEDGSHLVRAEMPGIDPDKDVDIEVDHGVLTIRAERREETKTEVESGYRSEFRYGSFARSVRLPAGATEQDVRATYHDGILEIRFPIDEKEAAARKIPVSRG
ncbi:MAG: Hsp20/alpha crystallin family protein [Acidimicrobiales bacterium]